MAGFEGEHRVERAGAGAAAACRRKADAADGAVSRRDDAAGRAACAPGSESAGAAVCAYQCVIGLDGHTGFARAHFRTREVAIRSRSKGHDESHRGLCVCRHWPEKLVRRGGRLRGDGQPCHADHAGRTAWSAEPRRSGASQPCRRPWSCRGRCARHPGRSSSCGR